MTEPTEAAFRSASGLERTASGDPRDARTAMAGFGVAVLRQALGAGPGNTVISPSSLFTVLAMARAGAAGDTAAQIDAALGVAGVEAQGHVVAAVDAGVSAALDRAARLSDDAVTVRSANETWVDRSFPVRRDYLDGLAREFGVAARSADFAGNAEGMRAAINRWVAERTNDLIPQLFPAGSITSSSALVLVNALYVKATWLSPFRDRQDGPFTTADGAVRTVPMMKAPLSGRRGDGWTAVTVPYTGGGLAMTVLLPDGRIDTVLPDLPAIIDTVAATPPTSRFAVTMPLFAVDTTPDATAAVQALGIIDLFTDDADLTGITDASLWADTLVHRCVVTVDENGTEAAAATGIVMVGRAAMQPEPLVIDRPFVFWIADGTTGAPLFLGVVTDPGRTA